MKREAAVLGESGTLSSKSYQSMNLDNQIVIRHRALELRNRGLPYSSISTEIFAESGVRLLKSTLSYWARNLHGPLGRAHPFVPNPTPDLAYVIGVERGDGSLNVREK